MAKRIEQGPPAEAVEEKVEVKKYQVIVPPAESYRCDVRNGRSVVETILVVDFEEVQAKEMRQRYRKILEEPNALHLKPGQIVEWPSPQTEPFQNRTYCMLRAGAIKEVA